MAVTVKRERPDQRRHHRVTAPLFVAVDGIASRAVNWSLGGLLIHGFGGELPAAGSAVSMHLTLPFQGFDVSFQVTGEVVRVEPLNAGFAVRFLNLGERERELMSHFLEELVRGSMVDIEDTIQRIDVPVTPASLEPDQKKIFKQLPVQRWPVKAVVMTAIYGLLGFFLFGYAALLGYSNFFRLEVQTAVISAPIETVTSQVDGKVEWTNVKPGDPVVPGQVVLNLVDSQLERDIELADIAVRDRKAQLGFLKRRQSDELDKLKSYGELEVKNIEQIKLDADGITAQLIAARQQLIRYEYLAGKGFTTAAVLEGQQKLVSTLQTQLDSKKLEIASRAGLAKEDIGRRFFTGAGFVADLEQIEAQVRLTEHEIDLAQQRYIANVNLRDRVAVRAPFEGTILELPRLDNGSVRKGDTVAIIEQRKDRGVTAFLNQDEVLHVGLGDEALVYVPAAGVTLKARVLVIDRTTGFLREQDQRFVPGYAWRGSVDRSAKIVLEFEDPSKAADIEKFRSGLPVVVVFEQHTSNSIISAISKKLKMLL